MGRRRSIPSEASARVEGAPIFSFVSTILAELVQPREPDA